MVAKKEKETSEAQNIEKKLVKTLPYPLSVNHYYDRGSRGGVYISQKGKAYKLAVAWNLKGEMKFDEKVHLHVDVYPPDNRKRDLDNLSKCLLDSIQESGVIKDDYDIDFYSMRRCEVCDNGKVVVTIEPYIPVKEKDLTGGFGTQRLNSNLTSVQGKLNRKNVME